MHIHFPSSPTLPLYSRQLLRAMNGESNIVECTFVKSEVTDAPYFSTPCRLSRNGVAENLGMGQLSDYEKSKLEEVMKE